MLLMSSPRPELFVGCKWSSEDVDRSGFSGSGLSHPLDQETRAGRVEKTREKKEVRRERRGTL